MYQVQNENAKANIYQNNCREQTLQKILNENVEPAIN